MMKNLFILTEVVTEPWSWWYWGVMVTINAISLCIFVFLFIKMLKNRKNDSFNSKYRLWMGILGLIYVCVAMYRSMFISSYPNRLAWFDSMANSMVVIRVLANFAEICFGLLIGLNLNHMNKEIELPSYIKKDSIFAKYLKISPFVIITCLITAQIFAWTGLLTQYLVLFAIEETLWTIGFASILPLVLIQLRNIIKMNDDNLKMYKVLLYILAIFTCGYLVYQLCFSLPFTYYTQLANDFKNGIHYSLNLESFKRALFEFKATRSFVEWGGIAFFIWHSGYFSICVWMNIYFAQASRKLN